MTGLISFEDAVTAANLNPNDKYGVYYVDGRFANHWAVRARQPHAKLYGITVFGAVGAGVFACDCENGDLTVPQALAWTLKQIELKVSLICVYASLDTWLNQGLLRGVQALEKKYKIHIKKWVAHYNNIPQIPNWADADQYADPGPIDRDIALANFFEPQAPVTPPKANSGHAIFEGTVDLKTGKVLSVRGLPGIGVHFDGPEKWIDVHVQVKVGKGGGQWRIP